MHWKLMAALLAAAVLVIACLPAMKGVPENPAVEAEQTRPGHDARIDAHAAEMLRDGREIFRYDSFGSEDFWGGQLRLHEAILGAENGGVGPGLSPKQALQLGLKVDAGQLPEILARAIAEGSVSLDDPETTVALLRAHSVVGVKAVTRDDEIISVGITCALCHSTVDDSITAGIGARLDGWPNRDLDVGQVAALAPNLKPFADLLGVSEDEVRKVFRSWGPGKYDAELNQDGKAMRPDGKSAATVLPAAFGLAGVNLHTYTGWGSVTHWNAYVAITQMHGKGTFFDPRLDDPEQFPVAARAGHGNIRNTPDLVTGKLAALHFYQLSIPAPEPPKDSFDAAAAARGKLVFEGKAQCGTCHVPPLFVEPGWPMHTPEEMGIDDFQASRSPDRRYRTTPLAGLFTRQKGGFYHDGRFPTYEAVVDHYDRHGRLSLTPDEKGDLVEYLKSL
ncbi:MAG TPA: hypothetical protein VMT16_13315 [Thermoanaerobaculia bacterium]|nr:hypothetical protein [Thermoanaerobaculia bacterium]